MDDRPFVSSMSRVEVFDGVLHNVVVLFMTTVYDRPSHGAVTVVRLLGGEPIIVQVICRKEKKTTESWYI